MQRNPDVYVQGSAKPGKSALRRHLGPDFLAGNAGFGRGEVVVEGSVHSRRLVCTPTLEPRRREWRETSGAGPFEQTASSFSGSGH